jgi:prepilin-type N-terminal cleavage/methylation domain-containing protein
MAFSLIEVMVAMLILGIALVGMVQGITTALGSNKDSELQTVASTYAAGQIEELRATGDITDGETEGDCGANLPLYRRKISISPAGLDGLHDVSVVIEHAQTGQEIYELRTMLFEAPDDPAITDTGRKGKKTGSKQRRRS